MKLTLDHHYSPLIAERLRQRHHDVVAAVKVGWEAEDDEHLLVLCAGEQRSLLTNDVADFSVIARRWTAEGGSHHGLIFTADASLPRTRDAIGRYVKLLDALMKDNLGRDRFVDLIQWL